MKKGQEKAKIWNFRFALTTALKAVLLGACVLTVLIYTNFTVDPGGVYGVVKGTAIEFEAVNYMLDGYNVEGMTNYNERLLKRVYVNSMPESADIIVMGSSRAALISADMLGSDDLFNLSVTGACFEDILALYGLLYEKDLLPDTLVLVVDPWMLNPAYVESRFATALGDVYYRFVTERMGYAADPKLQDGVGDWYKTPSDEKVPLWELDRSSLLNLVSIPYFQGCIQRYFDPAWSPPQAVPTDDHYGTNGLLRADGSYSYPESTRNVSVEQATLLAQGAVTGVIGLEGFTALDEGRLQMLRDFLALAADDGVEVRLFLQPMSPVLYDHMYLYERYNGFFQAEQALYDIAGEFGLCIAGSYDPHESGLTMQGFYDGYHVIPRHITTRIKPLRDDYDS